MPAITRSTIVARSNSANTPSICTIIDGRARLYDIRREPLIQLHLWLQDLQQIWWKRTRHTPTDPDYHKDNRLDANYTTRGTERIRTPRQLKDPWQR